MNDNSIKKTDTPLRLLVTGGGTGGHLFPAIAVAREFQRQYPGTKVLFVGTKRKIDTSSLARYGYASKSVTCHGVKGKNFFQLAKALCSLPIGCMQALSIIWKFKPHIVIGVGGYVTAPVIAAAKSQSVPTVIHEQNSIPGLANRKLGKLADRICLSLPGAEQYFDPAKTVRTGNPVRENILSLLDQNKGREKKGKCIAVLGGSQGAHAINNLMVGAVAAGNKRKGGWEFADLVIFHQTGAADCEMVRAAYKKAGITAKVEPFFTDMAEVYKQAGLVISRAGATTLSELSVLGLPAIVIPYPHAADNHQKKNGDYYANAGGAILYEQEQLTGDTLAEAIHSLLNDDEKRLQMGRAMSQLGIRTAAENIVACCMELIEQKGEQV